MDIFWSETSAELLKILVQETGQLNHVSPVPEVKPASLKRRYELANQIMWQRLYYNLKRRYELAKQIM